MTILTMEDIQKKLTNNFVGFTPGDLVYGLKDSIGAVFWPDEDEQQTPFTNDGYCRSPLPSADHLHSSAIKDNKIVQMTMTAPYGYPQKQDNQKQYLEHYNKLCRQNKKFKIEYNTLQPDDIKLLKILCKTDIDFVLNQGRKIHFIVDGFDYNQVASKAGRTSNNRGPCYINKTTTRPRYVKEVPYTDTISSCELRKAFRIWVRLPKEAREKLGIYFYSFENNRLQRTSPPWVSSTSNLTLWKSYRTKKKDLKKVINDELTHYEESLKEKEQGKQTANSNSSPTKKSIIGKRKTTPPTPSRRFLKNKNRKTIWPKKKRVTLNLDKQKDTSPTSSIKYPNLPHMRFSLNG